MADISELHATLQLNGYAIIASDDPEQAAEALAKIATSSHLEGADVYVIDPGHKPIFGPVRDHGVFVASSATEIRGVLDGAIASFPDRSGWANQDAAARSEAVLVILDEYEHLTRGPAGIAMGLARKAMRIAEHGAAHGVYLVAAMRTVAPAEVQAPELV